MLYIGVTNGLFLLRYALAGAHVRRRYVYYFVLLALFAFSAFRYQVGCDWSGYFQQYLIAGQSDWAFITSTREPLWWAILRWIHTAGLPYPVANIVSSAVFFIGVHVLARRQPDPLGFLVLLFPILIINMPMSGIRQGAAIGLLCIAFVAFMDRRPLRFSVWVMLAATFHASALVFMLLVPLATGRYTRTRLFMAAILAVPGAFLLVSSDVGGVAASRYIGTSTEAAGAVFRVSILGLTGLYFFLMVRKKWMRYWPADYSLASIGAIAMLFAAVLIPVSSVVGDRFGYYFIPIQAMIFARLPYLPFRNNAALHAVLPYLGLAFVFIVWSRLSWHFQYCYIPYQSWMFGFPHNTPFGF